jgi:hypothetical protein
LTGIALNTPTATTSTAAIARRYAFDTCNPRLQPLWNQRAFLRLAFKTIAVTTEARAIRVEPGFKVATGDSDGGG